MTAHASPRPHFTSHLPALLAGLAGTAAAAVGGSWMGPAGTWAGLLAGAAISSTVTWYAEQYLHRARLLDYARHRGWNVAKGPLARPRPKTCLRLAALLAAVVLAAITCYEAAAGDRPLANIVRSKPGHGLTLTDGNPALATPPPVILPVQVPATTPVTATPSPAATPTGTAAATPNPSPSTTVPADSGPPETAPALPTATPTPAQTPPAGQETP